MGSGCGFVFGVTTRQVLAWFMRMVEGQWNVKGRRTENNSRRQGARRNSKKLHSVNQSTHDYYCVFSYCSTNSIEVVPHEIPSGVNIGATLKCQV
jgi:hypothetical protein